MAMSSHVKQFLMGLPGWWRTHAFLNHEFWVSLWGVGVSSHQSHWLFGEQLVSLIVVFHSTSCVQSLHQHRNVLDQAPPALLHLTDWHGFSYQLYLLPDTSVPHSPTPQCAPHWHSLSSFLTVLPQAEDRVLGNCLLQRVRKGALKSAAGGRTAFIPSADCSRV